MGIANIMLILNSTIMHPEYNMYIAQKEFQNDCRYLAY